MVMSSVCLAMRDTEALNKREVHEKREVTCTLPNDRVSARKWIQTVTRPRLRSLKSQIRAKVEHPFRYIKRDVRLRQGPLPGTIKEPQSDFTCWPAFTNLLLADKFLPTFRVSPSRISQKG